MSHPWLRPAVDSMGQLLGPRSVAEIVITLYENDQINFQMEGMKGPLSPQVAYKLLATVAKELEPALTSVETITKETPQ